VARVLIVAMVVLQGMVVLGVDTEGDAEDHAAQSEVELGLRQDTQLPDVTDELGEVKKGDYKAGYDAGYKAALKAKKESKAPKKNLPPPPKNAPKAVKNAAKAAASAAQATASAKKAMASATKAKTHAGKVTGKTTTQKAKVASGKGPTGCSRKPTAAESAEVKKVKDAVKKQSPSKPVSTDEEAGVRCAVMELLKGCGPGCAPVKAGYPDRWFRSGRDKSGGLSVIHTISCTCKCTSTPYRAFFYRP